MKSLSGPTVPIQLTVAINGSIISSLVVNILVVNVSEYKITDPLLIIIGIGAGLVPCIALLSFFEWLRRWQDTWDHQKRQLRNDSDKLKSLQPEIYFTRLHLSSALVHEASVLKALEGIGDLDSELLRLSISLPDFAPDDNEYTHADVWESFLDKLYPYARDGDIAGARRLGRLTWRIRLARRVRNGRRSLSRWVRLRLRKLRSTPKRNKRGRTRHRGRRSGGVRRG